MRIKDVNKEQSYLIGIENKIQELLILFSGKISRNVYSRFSILQDSLTAVTAVTPYDSCGGLQNGGKKQLKSCVKTLLDMFSVERERTNSDSTGAVRTAMNAQESYEVDAMKICLLQDLSRRVGVWRAMQLGSLCSLHCSVGAIPMSTSSPSFMPSLLPSLSPSLLPSLPHALLAHTEETAIPSMGSLRDGDSVVCSVKGRELHSSPFRLFGFTDLHREANLTISLLNTCVSLFKPPPNSAVMVQDSGEHSQHISADGVEGAGEEFNSAVLDWTKIHRVQGSLHLEPSSLHTLSLSANELIKKWSINEILRAENNENVTANNGNIDEVRGMRSGSGNGSGGVHGGTTLTSLDEALLREFKRHWGEVLSGKYNSGSQDRDCSADTSHANTNANNSTTFSTTTTTSSSSSSSSGSSSGSSSSGSSKSKSACGSVESTLCASINTAKHALLTVSSVITASYSEYDPTTDGWRSGVSGVGLSLESRLEGKMETVKALIRDLSFPWFLQVQGTADLELPAVNIFQGDHFEDLCVCMCMCVCVFL